MDRLGLTFVLLSMIFDERLMSMSKAEIIAELPNLSHSERRDVMRVLFEMEQDAATLAACDRAALERFQMLDALEAEDETNAAW